MTTYSQPGIINALDYGLVPNDESAAYTNTAALTSAILAAQASCDQSGNPTYGGIVIIPSNDMVPSGSTNGDGGQYYFATESLGPAITIACPYPIMILGTGNASKLVMMSNNDLFEVNNNPGAATGASGGVTFQDLEIVYSTGLTSGAAIRVTGGSQNVRLFRIVLNECPVGVAFDKSLQCSMIDCVVWFATNSGNAVTLGTPTSDNLAKEIYIAGCLFEASQTGTGLSIVNADEVRVMNTRIEGFQQGILIAPSVGFAQHVYCENVSVFSINPSASTTVGASLLIQPTSGGSVIQAVFVGCQLWPTEGGPTSYTGPGVLIDQSKTTGVVDQIRLVSCSSSSWPGDGLQINGLTTNVEILGGYYSCNGQSSSGTYSGILITSATSGAPEGVRIVGVACNNSVYTENGGQLAKTQGYGISIGAGPTKVGIHGCDLTNNVTANLSATTPDSSVTATDCAGYNNQATPLATAPPGNGVTLTASGTYSYCGPIAFYTSGGTVNHIKINGKITGLAAGGFTLGPGEAAELDYTSAPTFYAVGK